MSDLQTELPLVAVPTEQSKLAQRVLDLAAEMERAAEAYQRVRREYDEAFNAFQLTLVPRDEDR